MSNVIRPSQFARQPFRETNDGVYYGYKLAALAYRRPFRITRGMVWFYIACLAAGIGYAIVVAR
jgi:hypothetical protein